MIELVGDRAPALDPRPGTARLQRADLERQILELGNLTAARDQQALHDVLELPHVAGPRIGGERRHRRGRNLHRPQHVGAGVAAVAVVSVAVTGAVSVAVTVRVSARVHLLRLGLRVARHDPLDEQRDVIATLAQRRNDQVNDVEAVEQVLTELLLDDQLTQVPMRRRNHAQIDFRVDAIGAHLLQLAGLEEPQQQTLHAQGHVADFVEEQRAAFRDLELAELVAVRAGEAALHVTQQLRLEERLGQPRAVDGDEAPLVTRTSDVNLPGDQLLPGAALAGNQHLRV